MALSTGLVVKTESECLFHLNRLVGAYDSMHAVIITITSNVIFCESLHLFI